VSAVNDIKRFIVAEFAPDSTVEALDGDFDLFDSGVVDSLGLLRLIAWVGARYRIPVEEIELVPDDFRTVDAIRAFVEGAARSAVG